MPPVRSTTSQRNGTWVLESRDGGGTLRRMPVRPLPFRIGRMPGLELVLPSQVVSKTHAELFERDGGLYVRDWNSTNGTFVNREAVVEARVAEGDILHFADFEFRLGREDEPTSRAPLTPVTAALGLKVLPQGFLPGTRELLELLAREEAQVFLQPIVRMHDRVPAAYEVLGRGCHAELPGSPDALFAIAAAIGVEVRLSRLFRRKTVELLARRHDLPALFVNTHPGELAEPEFLPSIEEMRRVAPASMELIVEVHERALAQPSFLANLRQGLDAMNVRLAYDDFGTGQARLLELGEAPPHYLKFDRRFVAGIDEAPESRQRLLASLVSAAHELGVHAVAEGVENEAEATTCRRLGFDLAQGFYFGVPIPADASGVPE